MHTVIWKYFEPVRVARLTLSDTSATSYMWLTLPAPDKKALTRATECLQYYYRSKIVESVTVTGNKGLPLVCSELLAANTIVLTKMVVRCDTNIKTCLLCFHQEEAK